MHRVHRRKHVDNERDLGIVTNVTKRVYVLFIAIKHPVNGLWEGRWKKIVKEETKQKNLHTTPAYGSESATETKIRDVMVDTMM